MSLILKTLPNEKRLGKLIGHKPINTILCKNRSSLQQSFAIKTLPVQQNYIIRSSPFGVFLGKGVLKIAVNLQENTHVEG